MADRRAAAIELGLAAKDALSHVGPLFDACAPLEMGQGPGPKGRAILLSFRVLKPPAPFRISDRQL